MGVVGLIRPGHDLSPLFGPLPESESAALTRALLEAQASLDGLAAAVSAHVGVVYRNLRLDLTGPYLDGGLTGDAGDVWFEIERPYKAEPPPWEVSARLIVFCDRRECRTHDLIRVDRAADTPGEAVVALQAVITEMGRRIRQVDGSARLAVCARGPSARLTQRRRGRSSAPAGQAISLETTLSDGPADGRGLCRSS